MTSQEFLLPFFTILLTEIGDGSFITLAYLASKTHRRLTVLTAAMLAYGLMNSTSALLGNALTTIINMSLLHKISGLIFIAFGLASLFMKEKAEKNAKPPIKKLFFTTFSLILLTEILDRSNLSTALFATHYSSLPEIAGVLSAHFLTALLAIELGKRVVHKIPPHWITTFGGILFLLIGSWTLWA